LDRRTPIARKIDGFEKQFAGHFHNFHNAGVENFRRNAAQGTASTGRSQVEWDLVKRKGALKIVRFTGTSTADTSQTAPK
jgi:hypothetical protein